MKSEYIITADWLFNNLDNSNLVVLDASLKPITSKEESNKSFVIPKARRFDLNKVFSNTDSSLDHTMLNAHDFATRMREIGISNESIIVVYDNQGIYSSPRAWYMIRSMGHQKVFVLDGGLKEWTNLKLPLVEHFDESFLEGNFTDRPSNFFFCDANYILENQNDLAYKVIDARSEMRFLGLEPEPRPNTRSGHIPGSINLPFTKVLDNGKFKTKEELEEIFKNILNDESVAIYSCGSGVTACIIALAATISGYKNFSVYDGSWNEWGNMKNDFLVSNPNEF